MSSTASHVSPGLERHTWRTCRVRWMAHVENSNKQKPLRRKRSCRCDTCATRVWLVSHMNVESTRRSAGARPRGLYSVIYRDKSLLSSFDAPTCLAHTCHVASRGRGGTLSQTEASRICVGRCLSAEAPCWFGNSQQRNLFYTRAATRTEQKRGTALRTKPRRKPHGDTSALIWYHSFTPI